MGKASNKVVKGASCSKKVKANSIANPKDNKNEYLKVHVQGQEPLFLPFDANKNVLFKDLRAKLSRASYLVLKKHGETYICDMKDGVIEEPDVEWDGGRVWAIVEPKASKAVSDKANVKRKKILAQLAPANRLPSHLNQIWERFDVSSWEELYASPRFSAPYQCNMARFLEYRNGVIQLFTPIIMRQGPEGFDLFTMFRISEGDYIVCDVLKELLKGSRECSCCNKGFVDELEALRHYFDLEHAYRSRKMFDEPVYVSAILETAREYGVFLPMQEFASADDDTTDSNKTSRSTSESSSVPSSAKALKRVKAEIVDLISPPGSPASNSHLIVRQDLPSFSTPSPVDEPVEAEVHREPSPLPPQAVHQPINEWQQPPVYRLGFNGYTPAMQPPPALPVNRGYGLNPNPIVPNHPVPNANYGRDPSLIRQIPDMTLPPPSVPTFFFAPPPPGPQNGMPPLSRTMHPHNALVINRTQQPESLTPSPRQRRESDAVVPTAQSAYPPERAHPRHDNYEAETPRTSRRRQDSEAVDAKSAQPSQLPKRSTLRNANHESLPTGSKCLPATVQASPPIKKSKHTQENANLPTPASVAKVHISIDTIGPSATPPQAKKSKRTTQNPNTEPIPASVSKVPAPIEVKPAPPSRGQHIIFSSDDEEEVSPPPQPSKPSRPGWKQVLSDSSSDSSDSEDPAVPYRQHLAKKKTPAPSPLTAKRVKVATKSPTPPPAKKSRTTSASDTLATPPSTKKKPASKSKQKSKDPPPVVDMMSDSEASGAPIPESRSGTKQPSMRPAMVPYEDFVPEYKCDLTTPIVTMDGLLEHFKVSSEGALFKLKAFQMPVKIPNFAEFIDYRKFILRNIRSFCIRQRADFPFIFYMFKALKSENIYLADIDKSYAMNCEKCDNSPLTLNHLFSRGHIMMFSKTRLDELQIGMDYIREQIRSTTGCNSAEYNIDPFNPAYLHLLNIYKASTINELCLKLSFRSTLLPEEEVSRFRTDIIKTIVNTHSPKLPFIVLLTFSIDKLIYLRDHVASNLSLRVRCGQEGTLRCRCGQTLKGYLYVVHVLKENHLDESAFETLKNVMDDMFLTQVDNPYGPPTVGYTTIENLSNCPYADLKRILRGFRRNRDRMEANAVDRHFNDKITAIEAELLRRGYPDP